jgi:hypothetical protein
LNVLNIIFLVGSERRLEDPKITGERMISTLRSTLILTLWPSNPYNFTMERNKSLTPRLPPPKCVAYYGRPLIFPKILKRPWHTVSYIFHIKEKYCTKNIVGLHRSQLIKLQEPEYPVLGNWGMLNPNITIIFLSHF